MTPAHTHDDMMLRIGAGAVLVAFVIETITNAVFGYREAGLGLAAVFAAIAVFGALCGVLFRRVTGNDVASRVERATFFVAALVCFLVSQVAGNSVFSTMLADGGIKRTVEATSGATARDDLKRLRDELAAIGITRPVATIEPEENLECRKTSAAYKDGVGPQCTRLRAELGRARRAAALPDLIAAADARVRKGPLKADGEGFVGQLKWLLQSFGDLGDDNLRRGFVAFLTFVLGVVANFGPAMMLGRDASGAGDAVRAASPAAPRFLPSHAGTATWVAPEARPLAVQPVPPPSTHHTAHHTVAAPAMHFHLPGVAIDRAAATDAQVIAEPVAASPVAARPASTGTAVAAPEVPVDRTIANQIIDQMIAFRAACLATADGDVLSADTLYDRYRAWAGGRSLDPTAFHSVFGPFNGVPRCRVGDVDHYYGIAFREAWQPQLAATG